MPTTETHRRGWWIDWWGLAVVLLFAGFVSYAAPIALWVIAGTNGWAHWKGRLPDEEPLPLDFLFDGPGGALFLAFPVLSFTCAVWMYRWYRLRVLSETSRGGGAAGSTTTP